MTKRHLLVIAVITLVVLAIPLMVFAQTYDPSVPPDVAPTVPNCTALSPAEAQLVTINLGGASLNTTLLAVYVCTGFNTNRVGDSEELFGYDCASGITIYKVENTGRQGLWDVPNKICSGDIFSMRTGGTGHYIVYGIDEVPSNLPRIIIGGA